MRNGIYIKKNAVLLSVSFGLVAFCALFVFLFTELYFFNSIFLTILYLSPPLLAFAFSPPKEKGVANANSLSNLVATAIVLLIALSVVAFLMSPAWLRYHFLGTLESYLHGHLHIDTAMHTAIIQSIVRSGLPSTGMHGDVLFPYHVATHYFDAIFPLFTGIRAFDIYGAATFLKAVSFSLAILVFTLKLTPTQNFLFILAHYTTSIVALVYTGHAIGSHSLWLPSILLIILWPHLSGFFFRAPNNFDFILLAFLGVVIALGKVSLGAAFMSIIGLLYFFQHPKDSRVWALGFFWLVFLVCYSSFFIDRIGAAEYSFAQHIAFYKTGFLTLFLCTFVAVLHPAGLCRKSVAPISVTVALLLVLTWGLEVNSSDHFYFDLGVVFIGLIIILTDLSTLMGARGRMGVKFLNYNYFFKSLVSNIHLWLGSHFSTLSWWRNNRRFLNLRIGSATIGVAGLFVIYLVFFQFSPISIIKTLRIINAYPFAVHNANSSHDIDRLSFVMAVELLLRGDRWETNHEDHHLVQFRDALRQYMGANDVMTSPVFISTSVWREIAHEISSSQGENVSLAHSDYSGDWRVALSFSAFLGLPLLNAIPEEHSNFYGFFYYGDEGRWVDDDDQADCLNYSSFVRVVSFDENRFEVVLCAEPSFENAG